MEKQLLSVKAVFDHALEIESLAERKEYLDRACVESLEVRQKVEALLRAYADAGSFLESPGPGLAATIDDPITERPGTVIGPYKLLEQIGEGGFGVVFMAEQTRHVRRKVALKVLKLGMDTRQVVARFEAERQALALMDHPNIAHIFDGGETDSGRPYFVMELVRGIPITEFCDQSNLPVRERLELFVTVCQAVQHAHLKGIIHRDLKPANIMVTMHDATPVAKVIDFGIAKAMGQQLTEKTLFTNFAQMIGTPLYMSPEQALMSGLDADTRSDIYSLGVLLYELLTGTTPFDKERLKTVGYDEIRRIIREEEPPKPSTRISTLGQAAATTSANRGSDPKRLSQLFRGELDWIVMKALEKDRNRRYETASAFVADVQRYLNDEPVLACPPSFWYRFRKFARRNKAGLAVAGLVLFFIVLLGGGAGWAMRDRSAREEEVARDRAARQIKLNQEVEVALQEANAARDQALTLTDNPYRWEAALAEAASVLKRAQGLASQDETAVEPAVRERLQDLQALLDADETDRRFAARFDEIRLEQSKFNVAISGFKLGIAFTGLKEAFHRYYQIAFGATPAEQAVTILQQPPKQVQDVLLAALDLSLDNVPKDDPQMRQWLTAVLDGADTGPWRKRARQALQAGDWKAFEQVVEEAVTARKPPSLLVGLAWKTPLGSAISIQVSRRIRRAYPGDFWANHNLAGYLNYGTGQCEEAIRYYTAAQALRPGNPATCVHLGNALSHRGDPDGAIAAYHDALDRHPDFAGAHECLGLALEQKGFLDEAIAELRETIRLRDWPPDQFQLGNVLARKGHWREAAAAFDRGLELEPTIHLPWYRAAGLHLGTGDVEGYRRICREMLKRFGDTDQPEVADPTAKTCLLLPDAVADIDRALKLADQAVTGTEKSGLFHWFQFGKGLAEYRAGRHVEAVQWLERLTPNAGGEPLGATVFAVLAMAQHRMGRAEQAEAALARAKAIMAKMPDPARGRPFGHHWLEWLHAQVLCREAEELLKKESGVKGQEPGKQPS